MGAPVTFDAEVTHVVLPNPSMASVPLTGTANPAAEGYTSRTLNERCGESRLEGGMHFNASVPAGRELCSGIGAKAAQTTKLLAPLPAASSATLRSVIASTPPCAADCCADSAPCTQAEQAACASNCTGAWSLPWFDVVDVRVKAFGLPDREIATSTAAPFFQADRNHLVVVGLFGAVVPAIQRHETIFQLRFTNTIDNLVWNSIAANSEALLALNFGQSRVPAEPTIRSGVSTSDARVVTSVHAVAAALPLLLPQSIEDFQQSLGFLVLSPTIGIDDSLVGACGHVADAQVFDRGCISTWYESDPKPSRLGQTIAYELMFHKTRDGWNSLGTDGCDVGEHFCFSFSDTRGWDPESGPCASEFVQ